MPFLSVNCVYQLTGYKLSLMKLSNTANVYKIDVLMNLNARGGARRSGHVFMAYRMGQNIRYELTT